MLLIISSRVAARAVVAFIAFIVDKFNSFANNDKMDLQLYARD
jgi:hypothetical protein